MKAALYVATLAVFYFAVRDMPATKVSIPACTVRLQDPHHPKMI